MTVTLNDKNGLARTINSLRSQDYRDIEHIVVDGGSTDQSVELLKSYEAEYLVSWISESDSGIYDAMNKGACSATGDILLFLNSGDVLTREDTISYAANKWQNGTWKWAYGAMRYVNTQEEVVGSATQYPFHAGRLRLGFQFVPHQATFISRDFFNDLGGYRLEYRLNSEQEFAMRASQVSEPEAWVEFICDFLIGGAHSSMSGFARERSYHQMRMQLDELIFNSLLVDRVFAFSVAIYRELRAGIGRLRMTAMPSRPKDALASVAWFGRRV